VAPHDPLAMQRYRAKKKLLDEHLADGTVQPWQAKAELTALAEQLLKKRGAAKQFPPPEPDPDGSSSG
jgi:hypothetical protein